MAYNLSVALSLQNGHYRNVVFHKQVRELLTDDEYGDLQAVLVQRPNMGRLLVGGGGLRKVRWRVSGQGKRGGVRVIYYWAVKPDQLLMMMIYPKSRQDDLTPDQLRVLKTIIQDEYP